MATLESPAFAHSLDRAITDVEACPSCGAPVAGDFCAACGEKRLRPGHFSLRHFAREAADELFDVDSRALHSLRLLLFRPGALTLEYLSGRRRPYLGPLRMYLAAFALAMFAGSLIPDSSASGVGSRNPVAARFTQLVHAVAVKQRVSDAVAEKSLAAVTNQHVGWISILVPLVFAAFCFAIFHRRRRWYAENLVYAIHFATFNYAVGVLVIVAQPVLRQLHFSATLAFSGLTVVVILGYLAASVRRVYGTGRLATWAATVALFVGFSFAQVLAGLLALATASVSLLYF
jgi:hypothetical protein